MGNPLSFTDFLSSIKKETMVADFSQTPPDLLDFICNKFTNLIDYVRFRAVCPKWRSSTSPIPRNLPTQIPWIILPFDPKIKNYRCLFNLSETSIYLSNLPELCSGSKIACCGSSQGWLTLLDIDANMFLFNPITRNRVQLPPLTSFPNILGFEIRNDGGEYLLQSSHSGEIYPLNFYEMCDGFIQKVVLSSNPNSSNEDYIAVAIFHSQRGLAFCKKGSEVWNMIHDVPDNNYIHDVIYYKDLFYAVYPTGSLVTLDLINGVTKQVLVRSSPITGSTSEILYLVDVLGDLLLVCRHIENLPCNKLKYLPLGFDKSCLNNFSFETAGFDVYTFDWSEHEWVKVTNLGDRVLFVGGGFSSMCFSATDSPGCEGNCIYFSDDYSGMYDDGPGHYDMGVFSLGDGSIKPLPYRVPKTWFKSRPPIWFTPNPC